MRDDNEFTAMEWGEAEVVVKGRSIEGGDMALVFSPAMSLGDGQELPEAWSVVTLFYMGGISKPFKNPVEARAFYDKNLIMPCTRDACCTECEVCSER